VLFASLSTTLLKIIILTKRCGDVHLKSKKFYLLWLLPIMIKRNSKFSLRISENRDIIVFPNGLGISYFG
jgi:hypothetical protein